MLCADEKLKYQRFPINACQLPRNQLSRNPKPLQNFAAGGVPPSVFIMPFLGKKFLHRMSIEAKRSLPQPRNCGSSAAAVGTALVWRCSKPVTAIKSLGPPNFCVKKLKTKAFQLLLYPLSPALRLLQFCMCIMFQLGFDSRITTHTRDNYPPASFGKKVF